MPLYTFRCWACGSTTEISRTVANRNDIALCGCGAWKRRQVDATAGLLGGDAAQRGGAQVAPVAPSPRVPNATLTNIEIVNCGTGIRMDGGHAVVRGLRVLETPTAFELNHGATVDGADIVHRAPDASRSGKKKRRRG